MFVHMPSSLDTVSLVYSRSFQDVHSGILGHVDSATMYRNEEPSAKGMLKSEIPRDQLYFTSKVPPKEVTYEGAKKAVDESLKKSG